MSAAYVSFGKWRGLEVFKHNLHQLYGDPTLLNDESIERLQLPLEFIRLTGNEPKLWAVIWLPIGETICLAYAHYEYSIDSVNRAGYLAGAVILKNHIIKDIAALHEIFNNCIDYGKIQTGRQEKRHINFPEDILSYCSAVPYYYDVKAIQRDNLYGVSLMPSPDPDEYFRYLPYSKKGENLTHLYITHYPEIIKNRLSRFVSIEKLPIPADISHYYAERQEETTHWINQTLKRINGIRDITEMEQMIQMIRRSAVFYNKEALGTSLQFDALWEKITYKRTELEEKVQLKVVESTAAIAIANWDTSNERDIQKFKKHISDELTKASRLFKIIDEVYIKERIKYWDKMLDIQVERLIKNELSNLLNILKKHASSTMQKIEDATSLDHIFIIDLAMNRFLKNIHSQRRFNTPETFEAPIKAFQNQFNNMLREKKNKIKNKLEKEVAEIDNTAFEKSATIAEKDEKSTYNPTIPNKRVAWLDISQEEESEYSYEETPPSQPYEEDKKIEEPRISSFQKLTHFWERINDKTHEFFKS